MRFGAYEFVPGLWPTLGAAALIALTVHLARWQTDRGDQKEALQALLESRVHEAPLELKGPIASAEPILFRRVRAAGEWVPEGQIFIDNQTHEGRAGFEVVTPLRIEGSPAQVLVVRGWVARTADYPRAPRVDVPAGRVQLSGLAALPPRRFLELSSETVQGDVWQNLSIERYLAATGRPVQPFVVLADVPAPGLEAVRERPDTGVERHREYALTWYALAATALALWIALNVRRAR